MGEYRYSRKIKTLEVSFFFLYLFIVGVLNNFFLKDSYFYPTILVAFFFIGYSFFIKKNSVRYNEVFFGFVAFVVLVLYYPFVKDEFQKQFFYQS